MICKPAICASLLMAIRIIEYNVTFFLKNNIKSFNFTFSGQFGSISQFQKKCVGFSIYFTYNIDKIFENCFNLHVL